MKCVILFSTCLLLAVCCKSQELASSTSKGIDYSKLPFEGCFIQNVDTYTIKNAIYYPSVNKFAFCSDTKVKYDVTSPYSRTGVTRICPDLVSNYKQGVFKFESQMRGQPVEVNEYFTADSTAIVYSAGSAQFKILSNAQNNYLAVLVDVPTASIKKAAIYTPDELNQAMASTPGYEFKRTNETAQISGFNCLKIIAKDIKSGQVFDVWITNDISLPDAAIPKEYRGIFGVPIKYWRTQQGQQIEVTIKSINGDKAPAGTFSIPADFDKISQEDLENMGGGKQ